MSYKNMSIDEIRRTVELEMLSEVREYFRFKLKCKSKEFKNTWEIAFVDWLRELNVNGRKYVASRPCYDDTIQELSADDEDDTSLIIQYTAL